MTCESFRSDLRCVRFASGRASGFPDVACANQAVSSGCTATIHDEWIRSIVRRRPDDQQEELRKRLLRTADLITSAIPDSLVAGYESLIPGIQLPDPDDRHVVAAAIFARAEDIVTFNLKDFPTASLQAFNVQALDAVRQLNKIPRLGTGKIDYRRLRALINENAQTKTLAS